MNISTHTSDPNLASINHYPMNVLVGLRAVWEVLVADLGPGLVLARHRHHDGLVQIHKVLLRMLDVVDHAIRVTGRHRPAPPGYMSRDCRPQYHVDGGGYRHGDRIAVVLRRIRDVRERTGRTPEVTGPGGDTSDPMIAWWRDVIEWDRRAEDDRHRGDEARAVSSVGL